MVGDASLEVVFDVRVVLRVSSPRYPQIRVLFLFISRAFPEHLHQFLTFFIKLILSFGINVLGSHSPEQISYSSGYLGT